MLMSRGNHHAPTISLERDGSISKAWVHGGPGRRGGVGSGLGSGLETGLGSGFGSRTGSGLGLQGWYEVELQTAEMALDCKPIELPTTKRLHPETLNKKRKTRKIIYTCRKATHEYTYIRIPRYPTLYSDAILIPGIIQMQLDA